MSVAPSFVNFDFLCEPYELNGKIYVRVRNPKTGTERQVRWYPEGKEPRTKATSSITVQDSYTSPQKNALGFEKGYITIFKGNIEANEDWFKASPARYARTWGWYFISTEPLPANIPKDVEPIQLFWETVGDENGKLYLEEKVQQAVESLMYADHPSKHIGIIGERIETEITIIKAIEVESKYGHMIMHIMEDADCNQYVWTTSAKSWKEKDKKLIRASIKDHRLYKGIKQTILTRCLEV